MQEFDPWVGKIPWRRKWQPIPIFSPGKCHVQRSLAVHRVTKVSDTTEHNVHTNWLPIAYSWPEYLQQYKWSIDTVYCIFYVFMMCLSFSYFFRFFFLAMHFFRSSPVSKNLNIFIEKNLGISGPMQFKPMLFKGQLYFHFDLKWINHCIFVIIFCSVKEK